MFNSTIFLNDTAYLTKDVIFCSIKFSSALIHIAYFILVILIKELRKRTLTYMHHLVLVGLVYNIHHLAYYKNEHPSLNSVYLNDIICKISEFLWAILKTLRVYSIALIAFYRFLAVFHVCQYRKLSNSLLRISLPLVIVYAWVIILVVANKYCFATTYRYSYCYDGFSAEINNSFFYFLFQTIVGIAIPGLFFIVVNVLIRIKIISSAKRAKRENIILSDLSSLSRSKIFQRTHIKHQRNLWKFFIFNVFELLSLLMVIGLNVTNINLYSNSVESYMTFFNLAFQSITPIITIIYNPGLMLKVSKC